MRNIVSTTIAAIALSIAITGAAVASPNTDGGDAFASKVLTNNSMDNVPHGIEGARNDGEEASLGFIVTNNVIHQAAATSELPSPNAE